MLLRWGICGAGGISNDFVKALGLLPKSDHQVVAVGASTSEKAEEFAIKHNIPFAFGSYEDLAQCSEIDIIYIGLINSLHKSNVLLALDNDKNVLCEKPMGVNAHEVKEMVERARKKKLFLMEGHWSRCFPVYRLLKASIENGEIGEPKLITTTFGVNFQAHGIVLSKKIGSGGLLSVGCYCTSLSSLVFGPQKPKQIVATAIMNNRGIDETASVTLMYGGEKMSQFNYALWTRLDNRATIVGTQGRIVIEPPMYCPTEIFINGRFHRIPLPFDQSKQISAGFTYSNSAGLFYEAEEVRQCLMAGELESKLMTLNESIHIAELNDEIRRQLKLSYDQDENTVSI